MTTKTKPKTITLALTPTEAGTVLNALGALAERSYFEDTVKFCEKLIRKVNRARKLSDNPDLV